MNVKLASWLTTASILALVAGSPGTASADCTSGLVAHYRFEGDPTDSSGFGNDGTALGNPGYGAGMVCAESIDLDGSDDWVRIEDATSLHLTHYTLSGWVKPRSTSNNPRLVEKGSSNCFWLYLVNGTPRGGFYDGSYHDVVSSVTVPIDAWSWIATTYDGSALRIYVDGTQRGEVIYAGSPAANTQQLGIGWKVGGGTIDRFDGFVDDVRIYDRALSSSEISDVYAGACDVSSGDDDGDGVDNCTDDCPDTALDVNVDEVGCSGEQNVDLDCPCDRSWRNHAAYMRCVRRSSGDQVDAGLITEAERREIIAERRHNDCGR